MQLNDSQCFHALIEHLERRAPDLVPACRWLACGPHLASVILGPEVRQPTTAEIARLESELDAAPAGAEVAGRALLATHARLVAPLDTAIEHLLAAADDEWSHPTEILRRPCPLFGELLAACRTRIETAGDVDGRLERVAEKLERAVEIEATASRRRAKWGRGR